MSGGCKQLAIPNTAALHVRARVKPILRWPGGKRWIIPYVAEGIHNKLLRTRGRYFECFLGGGALALDLGLARMVLSDVCEPLISMYQEVRRSPESVAWALAQLVQREGVTKDAYYKVRDSSGALSPKFAAARFLYLNALCFNGIYRENASGKFNVPYGIRSTKSKCPSNDPWACHKFRSVEDLTAVAQAFASSELFVSDFRAIAALAQAGDVIFADPPYYGTFTGYSAGGFDEFDQNDLAQALHDASVRGVHVVTTNADHPAVRRMYSWASVAPTAENRPVGAKATSRGRAGCLLITNDPTLLGNEER